MSESRAVAATVIDHRIRILTFGVAMAFMGLAFRLFQLQVIRGPEMERLAEMNRTQIIPLRAPRGAILDRNGEVLLDNAPHFSLLYSAESLSRESHQEVVNELVKWFPQSEVLVRRKCAEARQTGKMTRIIAGVDRAAALALVEKRLTMPGVTVVVEPQRHTRYGALASHVLGYVDEISPAELDRKKEMGYHMGQLIGKMGVERTYENALRGEDGGLQFEMDANGRHVHVMQQIPSKPGNNIMLTIDRKLQQAAELGLKSSPTGSGAAVVLDPRTGAVLALASVPDFDPSQTLMPHLGDPTLPLFNRALQGSYPPGSIFKMITSASALKDANWDIHKTYFCPGYFYLGSKQFGCWKVHGVMDFMGALAWSCDVYFYNVGLKAGPDSMERMAKAFGLGEKTGIDLPSESSGLIPGREWKREVKKAAWYDGDTVNFSIGQGAVSVTPLQAATMVAAIANGGRVLRPYVVEKIVSPEGQVLRTQGQFVRRQIDVAPWIIERLQQGMQGTAELGTGRGVFRPDLVVGAKTGTAQNPHGEDHAWFACYVGPPGEPASLVIVVCVEHGGHGASAAAPVARAVISAAFPLPQKPVPPGVKS